MGSLIYSRLGSGAGVSRELESAGFSGGRIIKTSSGYEVNYFITDHLGSTRVVFSQNLTDLQRSDYYPFGLQIGIQGGNNRYLYNGKESQVSLGSGYLDYGARFYDPDAVLMNRIDRFAEKYNDLTPYGYAAGNPIKYIDHNGDEIKIANNTAGALETLAKIAATSYGSTVLNRLIGSRAVYNAESVFWTSNSSYGNRTISYSGNPWYSRIDGGSSSSMITMGHETYHAYQDDTRQMLSYSKFNLERGAVGFENYLREVYNEGPMRERYTGLSEENRVSFRPLKIDTNGERITNFSILGNNENKTSFGFSYDKQTAGKDTQTYYMVVGIDDKEKFNYKIFSTEEEYKKATSDW